MSADPYRQPALHQGHDLDCSAWAVASACAVTAATPFVPSARFLLVEGRRQKRELDVPGFHGIGLRPVVSALMRVGVCGADLCPPTWGNSVQPDPAAYADAETRLGWWEVEALDNDTSDVDAALAKPNTVVVVSHFIDASWPAAKASDVLVVPAGSESAHSGILCYREPDGTYRYIASAGPEWADRGTCRVQSSIAEHSEERWRITYVGPAK